MAGANVHNMGGGVTVPGEGHALCHINVWIVGDHSETQLVPAVVPVKFPVLDLGLFLKSLTELDTA